MYSSLLAAEDFSGLWSAAVSFSTRLFSCLAHFEAMRWEVFKGVGLLVSRPTLFSRRGYCGDILPPSPQGEICILKMKIFITIKLLLLSKKFRDWRKNKRKEKKRRRLDVTTFRLKKMKPLERISK